MGDQLFTAYNYLSSSIAQAFAALIALTAMFYIYRIGNLVAERKSTAEKIRSLYCFEKAKGNSELLNAAQVLVNSFSDEELVKELMIELIKKKNSIHRDINLKMTEWGILGVYYSKVKKIISPPIVISSVTVTVAIIFLLIGAVLPSDSFLWTAMVIETILAIASLCLTILAITFMLEEPNASKLARELTEYWASMKKDKSGEQKVQEKPPSSDAS